MFPYPPLAILLRSIGRLAPGRALRLGVLGPPKLQVSVQVCGDILITGVRCDLGLATLAYLGLLVRMDIVVLEGSDLWLKLELLGVERGL